jgi:hypothetical protein
MSTATVHTPAHTAEPRGARLAAAAWLALRDALLALRQGLAERHAHRRRLAEAANVRALARQMHRHDPRVAVEMMAAADRHELG